MAGTSLLTLLDDIATLLDDISVMGKVAAKTAGVLGDDLSLNAQQVTGVKANRSSRWWGRGEGLVYQQTDPGAAGAADLRVCALADYAAADGLAAPICALKEWKSAAQPAPRQSGEEPGSAAKAPDNLAQQDPRRSKR